ncbi:DUF4214 domain-containing protein [Marinobacter sp.]|uniref:DUF4214 domain-containing protein n=1 Tax=Marinobacter sp. TaxID=50741 RepID=UPI003A95D990
MATLPLLNLPQASLSFSSINEAQQDLLVAIYVGAFNRAPEYEGLRYWAASLGQRLVNNETQYDALKAIGQEMYAAGANNGEGGTGVGTAEFVRLAYENSLGRSAGQAEIDYWANQIDSGTINRGTFITPFLDEALKNGGDSEFLQARVGVAEFMAQGHVSGSGAPGLNVEVLKNSIAAVKDEASALAAINQINNQYGSAPVTDSGIQYESRKGVVDIHLLKPDARPVVIENFDTNLDQFGMSADLKAVVGSLKYTGEPDSIAELQTPEYFTGVAGQAALLRSSQQLVIDLNGNGLYDTESDITISLPGVFQLEDWNFMGSDNADQPAQAGGTSQARTLPSTTDVTDVHVLAPGDGNLLVRDFEVSKDRFSMSAELKAVISTFTYVGEPDNQEELHTSEYFTGIAGQAALLRDSQLLVIDVDGNGLYQVEHDISISMPGVFQLESYNFFA